jgi:hypothetical protein
MATAEQNKMLGLYAKQTVEHSGDIGISISVSEKAKNAVDDILKQNEGE